MYLRTRSTVTTVHAAALRWKLQIKLTIPPTHNILKSDLPVLALTPLRKASGMVATRVHMFRLLPRIRDCLNYSLPQSHATDTVKCRLKHHSPIGLDGATVPSISTCLLRPMAFCAQMRNWYSSPSLRFFTVWRDASGLTSATVDLNDKE